MSLEPLSLLVSLSARQLSNPVWKGRATCWKPGREIQATKPEKPKAPSTESGKPKAMEDKKVAKKKTDVPTKKARVS